MVVLSCSAQLYLPGHVSTNAKASVVEQKGVLIFVRPVLAALTKLLFIGQEIRTTNPVLAMNGPSPTEMSLLGSSQIVCL